MKKHLNLLVTTLCLTTTLIQPVFAKPQLKLLPGSVAQGQGTLVEVQLEDSDPIYKQLLISVNKPDKPLVIPMLHIEPRKYRAYLGIAADFTAGTYPFQISYKGIEVLQQPLKIEPTPIPLPSPTPTPENTQIREEIDIVPTPFPPEPIPSFSPEPVLPAEGILLEQPFTIMPGRFSTQNITYRTPPLAPDVQALIDQEEALVTQARTTVSPKQLWQGSFILPVSHKVSSIYGNRRYLNGAYNGYHGGVDFASPAGTPIKATNRGKVILARYFSKWNSNGNIVFLDHGHGVTSVYIHLSHIGVTEGQDVEKGQIIGNVGSTGRSTGPHLHWGVYLNGQNTDGLSWIRFSETFF